MPDSSVIDPQAIANLRALNPNDHDEFLREIAGIFLEDTPQRIAELTQSLTAGDTAKFIRAAHSIAKTGEFDGFTDAVPFAEINEVFSKRR